MTPQAYQAILDSYRPKLIPLEDNLTAVCFSCMKVFPAEFCLRRAREEGWITSQSLIVETSSGNMALGLALVCMPAGYRLTIVSDESCDGFLKRRLEDLGTRVEIVSSPEQGDSRGARLKRLAEIREKAADHFWVNQYDNPGNPGAYGFLAAQLVESLGQVDCLVAAVGSGGSACGTAGFLREIFPEMQTLGVDTFGSVLFGMPEAPRKLHGLGNSVLPRNLDHRIFDEVHWVTAAEACTATRMLHRETSLFCGGTSGAAWMVARHHARTNPGAKVVCLFPDDGYRYAGTIYSDEYLWSENLWMPELTKAPREIFHPHDGGPEWSYLRWNRRSYLEVTRPAISAAV